MQGAISWVSLVCQKKDIKTFFNSFILILKICVFFIGVKLFL